MQHESRALKSFTSATMMAAGFEIYDGFKPQPGEKIFTKTVNSCFKESGLLEYLREKQVKEVAIAGLMTDYCIDATVKCGFEHGF